MFIWNPKEVIKASFLALKKKNAERKERLKTQKRLFFIMEDFILNALVFSARRLFELNGVSEELGKEGYHPSPRVEIQPIFKKDKIAVFAVLLFEKQEQRKPSQAEKQEAFEKEWTQGFFAGNDIYGDCGFADSDTAAKDGGKKDIENEGDNFDDNFLKQNKLKW